MSDLSVLLGAALTCVVGGFLPWINGEVMVVGAALLLPPAAIPILVLGCATGQMASKLVVYGVTRMAPHRLPVRAQKLLSRAERYSDRRQVLVLMVLSGAAVAIPPFYLVTLACGMLRVPFVLFALAGFTGTAVRYGVIAWIALAVGGA